MNERELQEIYESKKEEIKARLNEFKQMLDQITSDVKSITQILNPPSSNIQIPWEQTQ
jgi:ABC-type Zn uptake system ZnuABC Zn-binding protein ZnuA